jgi:hypothetical protein
MVDGSRPSMQRVVFLFSGEWCRSESGYLEQRVHIILHALIIGPFGMRLIGTITLWNYSTRKIELGGDIDNYTSTNVS